jgi:hypothetical protein
MELVLSLKALWHRRRYVVAGLALSCLLALFVVFDVHVFPPNLKSRRHRVWVSTAQVLTDAERSAIGNLNQGFDPLVPRATVYANIMTSPALVQLIGQAARIPADEISVAGPIGTNGQRPQHGATAEAPGGVKYSLQLDTDETQPIIRITAKAPTSRSALALANAAAAGLTSYVTQYEVAQAVPQRNRIDIRELGPAIESPSDTGIEPIYFVPIYLVLSIACCMLVLFVHRFRQSWRAAPDVLDEDKAGSVNGLAPWDDPSQSSFADELAAADAEFEFDPAPSANGHSSPAGPNRESVGDERHA